MKNKQTDMLLDLTRAMMDAELARLRERQSGIDGTQSRIDALNTAVQRQRQIIADELEAPVAGPVLDRWGNWADRRRADLNVELARQMAELETQRQAAMRAFGRAEALRRLIHKQAAKGRRKG